MAPLKVEEENPLSSTTLGQFAREKKTKQNKKKYLN
jgi:hypothetical protein